MTDHYIAALEAKAHRLAAERDAARDTADVAMIIVNAVLAAHPGCTPDTCTTMAAIEAVTP